MTTSRGAGARHRTAPILLADAGYPEGLDIDLIYVDFGLPPRLSVLQANLAEVEAFAPT
ncbi:MAG: hypothetical protein IPK19_16735 [Chloroflexi bacterium]|nr:hypothetical protein [Chloroflexota bacterium]